MKSLQVLDCYNGISILRHLCLGIEMEKNITLVN